MTISHAQAIELLRTALERIIDHSSADHPQWKIARDALTATATIEAPTSEPVRGASIDTWQDRMRRDDYAQALSVYCRAEIADLRTALARQSASVEDATLLAAAKAAVRDALDDVSVHPCDYNDDAVRAKSLHGSMAGLCAAIAAMTNKEST